MASSLGDSELSALYNTEGRMMDGGVHLLVFESAASWRGDVAKPVNEPPAYKRANI